MYYNYDDMVIMIEEFMQAIDGLLNNILYMYMYTCFSHFKNLFFRFFFFILASSQPVPGDEDEPSHDFLCELL